MLGSSAFVKTGQNGVFGKYGTLKDVLILDEVAYPSSKEHHNGAILETLEHTTGNEQIMDTAAKSISQETVVGDFVVNYKGFGSDHIPFLKSGVPAMLLIERDNL